MVSGAQTQNELRAEESSGWRLFEIKAPALEADREVDGGFNVHLYFYFCS
jgi:hypothetical protein